MLKKKQKIYLYIMSSLIFRFISIMYYHVFLMLRILMRVLFEHFNTTSTDIFIFSSDTTWNGTQMVNKQRKNK
jgi:hypothetical protein